MKAYKINAGDCDYIVVAPSKEAAIKQTVERAVAVRVADSDFAFFKTLTEEAQRERMYERIREIEELAWGEDAIIYPGQRYQA